MNRNSIVATIEAGRNLVSDGAWGTFLHREGLQPGECPELWCLEHRDVVFRIAKSYVDAGADVILTNSFGGASLKLALYGLAERAAELNRAAAEISREAAGPGAWVAASVGPTGKLLLAGDVTEAELRQSFEEQVAALAAGGADALCIESMIDVDEAVTAVKAARSCTECEVICTFTFGRTASGECRTIMGVSPADAANAALEAGADAIGTNCGNGLDGMVEIVAEMRRVAPEAPILVNANAGLPTNVNGVDVFPETPEEMAASIPAILAAGANIVGGCCGTTPAHIAAIRQAVDAC